MKEMLLVIDGTALLFRMYFAGIEFTSTVGVEVGAVLGSTQTIKKMIKTINPRYIAVVFDAGQQTFRHEIDQEYKANRGAPPEDLKPQFDILYNAVKALGIRCFMEKGFEADDIMATLATMSSKQGVPCQMVTNDKDVAQVIQDGQASIKQVLYFKKEVWGVQQVVDKFGVRPDQVIDYLSMIGDSVDNIKGVVGVGPKSAQGLLQAYETIDGIYRSIDDIPNLKIRGAKSLQKKMIAGKADVYKAKTMITLKLDMDLNIENLKEELEYHGPNEDDINFYNDLGFTQPFRDLLQWSTYQ